MESAAAVLIFVRAPELGRVKTRLAAEVGARTALRVYSHLARHAVRQALGLGPRAAVRVCFTPMEAGARVRRWLGPGPAYRPQGEGDLGERMARAFRAAFAEGYGPVVVIGSDLPDLTTALLRRALRLLERYPAVLGPARDGGYYLLGLRRHHPEMFREIAWSTDQVFAQSLARLRAAGIEPALLDTLADVDVAADLPDALRHRA